MDPDTDYVHILAHEIGHAYAAGADTISYHDWLNETHAEWSALLYLEKFRRKLFEDLTEKMEAESRASDKTLCLRECGDRRPDNVHRTGTLIYYRIFKEYGEEVIAVLVEGTGDEPDRVHIAAGDLGELHFRRETELIGRRRFGRDDLSLAVTGTAGIVVLVQPHLCGNGHLKPSVSLVRRHFHGIDTTPFKPFFLSVAAVEGIVIVPVPVP